MKFGKVENADHIDFNLPPDDHQTIRVLNKKGTPGKLNIYLGLARWNKQVIKNFYPKGTKDDLRYYSSRFNTIELNNTFYNYNPEQIKKWRDRTFHGFKFCPKVNQSISHLKRLKDVEARNNDFCDTMKLFNDRLGMIFLQLHENFLPRDMDRLEKYIGNFPDDIPLGIELRNEAWLQDEKISESLFQLFEEKNISNIIVDTAGRRGLLHMRLTSPTAFVRYVGANHPSDYTRLDDWVDRIVQWHQQGLETLYFFVHQNHEEESPMLSNYLVEKLNARLGTCITPPVEKTTLF